MPEKSAVIDKNKLVSVQSVLQKYQGEGREDVTIGMGWRAGVVEKMREGDVEGMRAVAMPSIQMKAIELAHEAKSEQTQLQAIQFVLGQSGHGVVQKVHHAHHFQQMTPEQLVPVVSTKLARLCQLVPDFKIENILAEVKSRTAADAEPVAVDAEYEEVSE